MYFTRIGWLQNTVSPPRRLIQGAKIRDRIHAGAQIAQQSVFDAVDPAMNRKVLAVFPGFAQDPGPAKAAQLVVHIHLAQERKHHVLVQPGELVPMSLI